MAAGRIKNQLPLMKTLQAAIFAFLVTLVNKIQRVACQRTRVGVEDRRFYDHNGYLRRWSIARAMLAKACRCRRYCSGVEVRSTQQLVKNFFLTREPNPAAQGVTRLDVDSAGTALQQRRHSARRILTRLYLGPAGARKSL